MDNCQRQNRRATTYWLLDRSLRAAKFLAVITLHCLVKRRDSVTPPAPKRAGVATMRVRCLALLAPRFSAPRSLILAHVMRTAPSSRSLTSHVRCIHFNIAVSLPASVRVRIIFHYATPAPPLLLRKEACMDDSRQDDTVRHHRKRK